MSPVARGLLRFLSLSSAVTLAWACASGGEPSTNDPPAEDPGAAGAAQGGSAGASGGAAGAAAGGKSAAGAGGATAGKAGASGASGGASGGGSGGGPVGSGDLGKPCATGGDCKSGKCVDVGSANKPNKVCVSDCKVGAPCGAGFHCGKVDGADVCVPDNDSQCALCKSDSDCKTKSDRCLVGPKGEKFCAQDCGFDTLCGAGMECKPVSGGMPGERACVPASAASCPCAANRDGDERDCSKAVGMLTCKGIETCDAKTGAYGMCTAATPEAEKCDGKDNDCNGKVDDLAGAACSCNGTSCTIICQDGYSHYPPTLPDAAGCPCKADADEPTNDACKTAKSLPDVVDFGGMAEATLTGTLSSDADVDWYLINIKDAGEAGKNSYHPQVIFDKNPGDEFVLVVLRGGDCAKEATSPALTSYDFCVNFKDGIVRGEAPCGAADGMPHCNDNSSAYRIGVKRNPMAKAKTCEAYTLKVRAAAGPCVPASFDACGGN